MPPLTTAVSSETGKFRCEPKQVADLEDKKVQALDQRQAAEIFGGEANAFQVKRTARPSHRRALVKLPTIFDRHPKLLSEVQSGHWQGHWATGSGSS
jgi:Antitoxin component of bacterial toxin-antitoxin system, MqsA